MKFLIISIPSLKAIEYQPLMESGKKRKKSQEESISGGLPPLKKRQLKIKSSSIDVISEEEKRQLYLFSLQIDIMIKKLKDDGKNIKSSKEFAKSFEDIMESRINFMFSDIEKAVNLRKTILIQTCRDHLKTQQDKIENESGFGIMDANIKRMEDMLTIIDNIRNTLNDPDHHSTETDKNTYLSIKKDFETILELFPKFDSSILQIPFGKLINVHFSSPDIVKIADEIKNLGCIHRNDVCPKTTLNYIKYEFKTIGKQKWKIPLDVVSVDALIIGAGGSGFNGNYIIGSNGGSSSISYHCLQVGAAGGRGGLSDTGGLGGLGDYESGLPGEDKEYKRSMDKINSQTCLCEYDIPRQYTTTKRGGKVMIQEENQQEKSYGEGGNGTVSGGGGGGITLIKNLPIKKQPGYIEIIVGTGGYSYFENFKGAPGLVVIFAKSNPV